MCLLVEEEDGGGGGGGVGKAKMIGFSLSVGLVGVGGGLPHCDPCTRVLR